MPKKKEPPLSAAEQRRRFEALVRDTGAKTSAKQMREALGKTRLRAASSRKSNKIK